MPTVTRLRPPSALEQRFYLELMAPLGAWGRQHVGEPDLQRQLLLRMIRFKKELLRYGFLHTPAGVMVKLEHDVLDEHPAAPARLAIEQDLEAVRRAMQGSD